MGFFSHGQFNEVLMALVVAFIVTILSIRLLYSFSQKVGLIDYPNKRKLHTKEVPLIGGIAMFLGVIFGLLLLPIDLNLLKGYVLALMLIVALGVIDDYSPQSHWLRLSFQLFSGLILFNMAGIQIHSLGDLVGAGDLILGTSSVLVTIIAVTGAINAINFMDGVDGVSGGVSLVTVVSVVILSYDSKDVLLLYLALLILIVLIPFLFFNLKRMQKIFMGDAGSMFLGLSISILLIGLSQGDQPSFRPITALWIFALPLIDIFFVMFKRMSSGDSPFLPDRSHIHYIFLSKGLSDRRALAIIILMSIVFAIIGVFSELMAIQEWKMFGLFVIFSIIYAAVMLILDRQSIQR